MKLKTLCFIFAIVAAMGAFGQNAWNAPDRAIKVAKLTPGRKIPKLTRKNLFADWTKQQVEQWNKKHPSNLSEAQKYQKYAKTKPTDSELLNDFPRHISPLARVRSGKTKYPKSAANAFHSYCPMCQSKSFSLRYDNKNKYHATTVCCKTELYGKDFPANYKLKPTTKVEFKHLDGSMVKVPCTIFKDKDGVVWELYIKTLFDQRRWLDIGGNYISGCMMNFKKTGNPLYAHKIAVLLNAVADTYYGLPLCYNNELAKGKDGKALTRKQWENSASKSAFKVGPLGKWNRRKPKNSRGWLNMMKEHIWVEPYALTRHHPAFKQVSKEILGNPEALDLKIKHKILRELCFMFKSVYASKLRTSYQDAKYMNMILLAILAGDKQLLDFSLPIHEVTFYNHTYHDGLNGEGAPNYMLMPGYHFLPFLSKKDKWGRFQPNFVKDNPFYNAAIKQLEQLQTVRGLSLEFGDQHIYTFNPKILYTFHPSFTRGPLRAKDKRKNEKNPSKNWASFGVGILRVGKPDHRMELSMIYTRSTLHGSQDALSIECWIDGVPVMRRGGYSPWWKNAALQWERPEFKALRAMDYPHKIIKCSKKGAGSCWSWQYSHGPICQNGATIDTKGTGKGWDNNRGYGEVITFKGGEPPDTPGSDFQVLDIKDHYSWKQVGMKIPEFRRTLIALETSTGCPYALDIFKLRGGKEHTLFNSAWAERVSSKLPATASTGKDLEAVLPGGYKRGTDLSYFKKVNQEVKRLKPTNKQWELTWKTDFAAYAPRQLNGKPFDRPIPENEGKVRLRLLGFDRGSAPLELISAKGPWLAYINQPLPKGKTVKGVVGFEGARDFLIERRGKMADGKEVDSLFIHIIEGFRDGEKSAIKSAKLLKPKSIKGAKRDIVAMQLKLTDGNTDTVLYQSQPGIIRLPNGVETDARYALIRQGVNGKIKKVETCRSSFVRGAGINKQFPDDYTGEIIDIIGDLTGNRQESALIIKTAKPWPEGEALKKQQLLVKFESSLRDPCNEGYRIKKVTKLTKDTLRVDLLDNPPFITSWHDVYDIPKKGLIRTVRPLVSHGNSPWFFGMNLWFPEKGLHYKIKRSNAVGGGYGGEKVELVGNPDLKKAGIKPGDWFVIYGIRPGLKVNVASQGRFVVKK